MSSTHIPLAKANHIATSKFKREENDNPTLSFEEERDEIIVKRFNDYDSQHRDDFLDRKIDKNSVTLSQVH